jgi:hypothetical protein
LPRGQTGHANHCDYAECEPEKCALHAVPPVDRSGLF